MKAKLLLTGLAVAALSACGGGSDDTPAPTTTISGTAAVGAALANATVEAKCANGSGTATTGADGRFTLSIAGATRPCVLSATTPDGTVLHSVVEPGESRSATANITPLTELITAALANGDTAQFYANFDSAAQGRVTPANIGTAADSVKLVLSGVVDLTGFDPIKDTLVAATAGQSGNELDKKLDELAAVLQRAKTTIGELSDAMGANAGPTAIATVLKPASATCAGLRSGDYRMAIVSAVPPGVEIPVLTVDADKLLITAPMPTLAPAGLAPMAADPTPTAVPLVPVENSACEFEVGGITGLRLLVAQSGMALLVPPTTPMIPIPLLPAQNIPLAEMAGNWVAIGYEEDDGSGQVLPSRLSMTIGADGKVTAGADCRTDGACTPWSAAELPTLVATAQGFDIVDTEGAIRAQAFKSTDGRVSMFMSHDAGFLIATQQKALTLPAVGTTRAYWDLWFSTDTAGGIPTSSLDAFSTKVTEVNADAGTYVRERSDGRVDRWTINQPAPGLRFRSLSATASEAVSMDLGNSGMIVAAGTNPTQNYISFSVLRP